jgi:hypothetical protein
VFISTGGIIIIGSTKIIGFGFGSGYGYGFGLGLHLTSYHLFVKSALSGNSLIKMSCVK